MADERSRSKKLPVEKNEDVEFSIEQADQDDLEAVERAEAADSRVEDTMLASDIEQGGGR